VAQGRCPFDRRFQRTIARRLVAKQQEQLDELLTAAMDVADHVERARDIGADRSHAAIIADARRTAHTRGEPRLAVR
jgi:hypothetical protein